MNSQNHENQKQKPPISNKSMIYIHKIVLIWFIASLLIFYLGHYLNINQQVCGGCYVLSNKLWFIEDMATASRFTEGTRLQWLFLSLSCPVICIFLLYKINDVKYGDMKIQMPLFTGLMAIFSLAGILIKKDKSPSHGYYGLFTSSITMSPLLSFLIFYILMFGIIIVGLYIKSTIKYVIVKRRMI